eukprot:7261927-Prymnesium_polylepis.1
MSRATATASRGTRVCVASCARSALTDNPARCASCVHRILMAQSDTLTTSTLAATIAAISELGWLWS